MKVICILFKTPGMLISHIVIKFTQLDKCVLFPHIEFYNSNLNQDKIKFMQNFNVLTCNITIC
jgi:hypothetical protein